MKKIIALIMVLSMALMMPACGKTDKNLNENAETKKEIVITEKPQEDRSGAKIDIPEKIEKIAVLAPSVAETLINLGCEKEIAAVDTQTSEYGFEQFAENVAVFDMFAPNIEELAALKPDVVFVSQMTEIGGTDLYADLKKLGICVINIPSSSSIQAVKDDILFIAACVGKSEKGEQIVNDMTAKIDEIAAIGATVKEQKTVYFEIAAAPYAYSFGKSTFLNEMIEIIGAKNIFAEQEGWLTVDVEKVISANPDVILTSVNYMDEPVKEILTRKGWNDVNAVKNKAVYYIDNKTSSIPNESIVKALEEMAYAVYPEYY